MVLPRGNGRLQPQYTGSNRQATNDPNAENKRVLGDLHVVIPKRPAAENPRQPLRQPLTNRQRLPQASEKPQSRQLIAKRPQPQHPNYNDQRHFAQRRSRRHFVVDDLDVPKIMIHRECKEYYTKLEYLGEGGYAKCYRVKNTKGEFFAIKVITKVILQDTRTRNQLFSEINIHRSLNHCSIVKFHSCFEDDKNVYLVVELCENGTLADMVRKRSRISELEVRYFLIQLLDACRYLHENRVIHRDIKLSNVFLNRNMDIKIGDFGLAALLVNREDRKRTFCGTPNYIAPEILCKKSGHDHKVDIWSIGVLMFTMLVGKHPFQRKDMKETFRQIRQNSEERAYEFPVNIEISQDAKDLIGKLLVNAPEQRPSVPDILSHAFFQNHPIPQFIPRSALYHKPSEQEICPSTEEPRAATSSPGRVAEAMRHAIDQKRSYVDRTPLGPLRIMSEYIPDLRSQFPIQDSRKPPSPPPLEPSPVPAASANRKRPASVDHAEASPRKREPKPRSRSPTPELDAEPSLGKEVARTPPRVPAPVSVLETMMQVLTDAIDESVGWKGELGQEIKDILWSTENVFLEKWVDFSSKYGFGYTLTDGTHGALFNDSTTMLTKEENNSYLYITQNERLVKQIVQQDSPELTRELKKKMHLMDCFKKHMTDKHALPRNPNGPVSFVDTIFLSKYIATDRAVVFRLSNNVIQLNFFTHQKLVLTEYATKIIYIDENKELSMYLLTDAVTCGKKDIYDAIVYARNVLEEQVRQRLKTSKTEG